MSHYIAIDLGATSGRVILGTVDNGRLELEQLSRFSNNIVRHGNRCYWNIWKLYEEIINGLRAVASRGIEIKSIGIDTWGVDFALFGDDGEMLGLPRSYRDTHTEGEPDRFFNNKIPADELYSITGLQIMPFNSLFQLSALRRNNSSALKAVSKILFLPDALGYLLTGKMVTEYTIASTSQLLDANSRNFDDRLLEAVGLTRDHFGSLVTPGTVIGTLTPSVQALTGLGEIPVISVAGHDTASAVVAVPAADHEFAYLSSGTWSLMGIEIPEPIINPETTVENFTHEGGIDGTIRFLKNICGMWLLERCREEWAMQGLDTDYDYLVRQATMAEPFRSMIFPDDPTFANPDSMLAAITDYCRRTSQPVPETQGEITRCIYESLALRYRQVFRLLRKFAPFEVKKLHVIGGGSRNDLLNSMTADSLGVEVVAGPVECTAAGNILIQARAAGEMDNRVQMRQHIADSHDLKSFYPSETQAWDEAYTRYLGVIHNA